MAGHIDHLLSTWKVALEIGIATASTSTSGVSGSRLFLEKASKVRLLLEPNRRCLSGASDTWATSPDPRESRPGRARRVLTGRMRTLEEDRDLLGFARRCRRIRPPARRLASLGSCGGAASSRTSSSTARFIVTTDDEGVIAGSSNFTYAGLATNIELNLGHYDPRVVSEVTGWFDDLWERASKFDLQALYPERYEPHSPYLVYLRMLWERYGEELAEEATARTAGVIHLTSFQEDGLWRAQRDPRRASRCPDRREVGLSKTFLAG
ncbi:MAG: phospholipase D-like domain-containing protein [Acidimicrobiia bacterium]|nr:phospholipase D-like domain-containing protein [Acidimicrobiia bacterium]